MPTVTRELSVAYAGVTCGGTSSIYLLDGPVSITRDYSTTTVTFDVVVVSTSEANFATDCSALETAFRKPFQTLVVTQGSSTLLTSSSGFDSQASIRKDGSIADTGRSRRYECEVSWQMPADASGYNGRRNSRVELNASATGRQVVSVSGTYTAISSNTAREQYEASIGSYATAVLTAIDSSATFELISETATEDTNDKNLDFSRVYQEIIYNQADGTPDNTKIVSQQIQMTRTKISNGSYAGEAKQLQEIQLTYAAAVDKSQTDLKGLWENTIKSSLVDYAKNQIDGGVVAVVGDSPTFDPDNNMIQGVLSFMAVGETDIIDSRLVIEVTNEHGQMILPLWDGNPYARIVLPGPATTVMNITEITRTVTASSKKGAKASSTSESGNAGKTATDMLITPGATNGPLTLAHAPEGFITIQSSESVEDIEYGIESDTFNVTQRTRVEVATYVEDPSEGENITGDEASGVGSTTHVPSENKISRKQKMRESKI